MIAQLVGVIGLLCIIVGVVLKRSQRTSRDEVYILGGILLAGYSWYIQDMIFLALQIVFVIVAVYDLVKEKF